VDVAGPDQVVTGTIGGMSGERDELRRLVEELPDEQVPTVLAEVRRKTTLRTVAAWPPAWMNSFSSGRTDLGRNHEDLLADGFGRA
jgi:hypothetical protein